MKLSKTWLAGTLSAILFAFNINAAEQTVNNDSASQITNKLYSLGLTVNSIDDTPVTGLKQVLTDRGVFYVSADSKHFIQGRMFELANGGLSKNLTEEALAKFRLDGLKKFEDSMIIYPAKDEKYQVTVFTDITCGYCRKLHSEMEQYNNLGITVKYLAFPRGGVSSPSYGNLQSVWCSDDKADAMTKAKTAGGAQGASCENPVAEHYALGQASGVSGTPAMVLADGTMIPGYQPAPQLLSILQQQ